MTDLLATRRPAARYQASGAGADVFRPVQYLGSKARILHAIKNAIDAVAPARGPVVDLFSGSGVVAAHLARERSVTAVDIQEYARVLASALLAPARLSNVAVARLAAEAAQLAHDLAQTALHPILACERAAIEAVDSADVEPLCEIVEHGSLTAFESGEGPSSGPLAEALSETAAHVDRLAMPLTITRYYGGVYFAYTQALQLDCLLTIVRELPLHDRDTALAGILGAASDSVTSVGNHFAQPIRPRDKRGEPKLGVLARLAHRRQRDVSAIFAERMCRYAELPPAGNASNAVRGDYRRFLASHRAEVSAVYADPPYTRDHYSRFYHVLETIARGDTPPISTVTLGGKTSLSRGLYRRERHQSPFCIRSETPDAFRSLFAAVRRLDSPLVLSYSPYDSGTIARPKPRLLTIPELVALASQTFRTVEVCSAGRFSHSKLNVDRLNGSHHPEAEVFLVCS